MAYGLKPKEVEKILAVLSKHPQVNKAVLYGSRALGTHHKGSDIDLTLLGKELKFPELARIETELDDLLLPYQIDLSIYHQIDNDSLLNHIERVGVVFFERDGQPNKKKELKEGWMESTLEELCDKIFAGGDVPKSNLSKTRTEKYPIPIFANGEKNKGLYGYTDIIKVADPSITVSARGTIGYSEIRTEPFFPVVRLIVLTPNLNIVSINYLKYVVEGMDFVNTGTSIPQLTVPMIKKYEACIPPLSEQEEIVEVLDKAFAAIDQARANIEQNIANAKELFQSKLNQIFSQKGEGWVEKALIKVTSFIDYRGRTPKKTEEGIRLLTAKNVRMGYLKRNPEEFIAETAFDDWMTRGIPRKGDVLFTTEAPLANVTLLDTDEKIALAQRIITICPDRDILTGEYLSYCLQSKVSQDRILEKGTGATVTGIKSKLLKEIPIPIAPVAQQKSIVKQLDALSESTNALESHYQTKLASLDELKKSILQKAFAGELTVENG